MPEISRFFGIIVRMFFDEHNPPHFHVEYQGAKAVFDFHGNITRGSLNSKTATRLVRDWADQHADALIDNWQRALEFKSINPIPPLE